MTAYLVRHPAGDLLIDTGLGREAPRHYEAQSMLMRATSSLSVGEAAADQLARSGYDPARLAAVLPTHAHWDHISGAPDFPRTPLWLPELERAYATSNERGAEVVSAMRGLDLETYKFASGPYLGYPRSHDVWGDGSVVIVPAPGHTPGSVIVFVALPNQKRYAFVGDVVWQHEGIEWPAERPWPARFLVDQDADAVRAAVTHLHALMRRFPEMLNPGLPS